MNVCTMLQHIFCNISGWTKVVDQLIHCFCHPQSNAPKETKLLPERWTVVKDFASIISICKDQVYANSCSRTLMLKDLLTLLLLSLSVVVWCTWWSASLPPLFSRVECWLVLQCLLSVSLYRVWSPVVTSVVQPGPHVLHPSDTFPACLSSGQSSLVLEWHRIRDLDKINAAMKVIKKD